MPAFDALYFSVAPESSGIPRFFLGVSTFTRMGNKTQQNYTFGDYRLDVAESQLWRNGELVALTPKAYEVLVLLLEHPGHLISKEEFLQKVWAGSFVEENNLADNVSTLRKILGDDPKNPVFIETIPRRGYRFIGQVNPEEAATTKQRLFSKHRALAAGLIGATIITVGFLTYSLLQNRATVNPPLRSIAVLPFKPLIVNSQDEYLEFGLADALITKLGNVKNVSVRPTSSMLQYGERALAPLQVGHEQRVDAVLVGQFQKLNEHIRLTVQLVRVSDGAVVWAQTFDDRLTNIFVVQDTMSTEIARALRVQLSGEERQRILKRDTASVKAYDYYLRGRYSFSKWTREGIEKAIEYYQLAAETDPNYAAPVAALSKCYHVLGMYYESPGEMFPKAKYFAQKAVEMDSALGEAWSSLGLAKSNEWDWIGAAAALRTSVEVNPTYAEGHEIYAHMLMFVGTMDDAIEEMKKARAIDPLSPSILGGLANFFYNARRYDEAIELYRNMLELYPSRPDVHTGLALAYAKNSQANEALAEINTAFNLSGEEANGPAFQLDVAVVYALIGRTAEAQQIVHKIEKAANLEAKKGDTVRYFPTLGVARVYAALGEPDKAFEWLEKAYQEHTGALALIKVSPDYDALRNDSRHSKLLEILHL